LPRAHASLRLLPVVFAALGLACDDVESKPDESSIQASVAPFGDTTNTLNELIAEGQLRDGTGVPAETIVWAYSWTADGVDTGITTQVVDPANTAKNQVWEVTIGADFGEGPLEPARASIAVVNAAPRIRVQILPALLPGNTESEVGTILIAEANELDPDGDPIDLQYEWTVDGILESVEPTLDTSPYADGQRVRLTIVASDDEITVFSFANRFLCTQEANPTRCQAP